MKAGPSLAFRLSALSATVFAAVLLSLGIYLYRTVEHHFEQLDLANLSGKITLLRQLLGELDGPADVGDKHNLLQQSLVGHPGLHIKIFNHAGQAIFSWGDIKLPTPGTFPLTPLEHSPVSLHSWKNSSGSAVNLVYAESKFKNPSQPSASIIAALETSEHESLLSTARKALFTSILVALLITVLLGTFAVRAGLLPLRKITEAAISIHASDLSKRLDTHAVPAELLGLVQAFNAMLIRLEESFSRLSQYSSDLAHELRTPIQNLLIHNQVMLSKPRSDSEYRHAIESNIEEFEKLSRMISDMLFLARADEGEFELSNEHIELASELQNLLVDFDPLLAEHGITCSLQGAAQVAADRGLLRRVFVNLLGNAVRYTPPGEAITIGISTNLSGDVQVSFENPGPGLSPEESKRVFDRFVHFPKTHSPEGTGLGLAISESIMRLFGGSIAVYSSPQGPTRFVVNIPGGQVTK